MLTYLCGNIKAAVRLTLLLAIISLTDTLPAVTSEGNSSFGGYVLMQIGRSDDADERYVDYNRPCLNTTEIQLAAPRPVSLSSLPRKLPATRRPGDSFNADNILKDGKLHNRITCSVFLGTLLLYPSGKSSPENHFICLRKLLV